MTFSINTNQGSLIALQNLAGTQMALQVTQNAISTGKKVNTAQDNAAAWSIANTMTGKVASYDAVKDSLNRATSTVDVAMSAGQQVADLLSQLKAQALAGSDSSLDATSRASINSNFKSLLTELTDVVNNASFMVIFPLTFIANTFVPTGNFPTVLKAIANWNPVSSLTQAVRELFGNTSSQLRPPSAWSLQNPLLYTLIWIAGILLVFVPLSVRRYQLAATR